MEKIYTFGVRLVASRCFAVWLLVFAVSMVSAGCQTPSGFDGSRFLNLSPRSLGSSESPDHSKNLMVADDSLEADSVVHLNYDDDLADRIRMSDGNVLIDFYADWCGPCKRQAKILDTVAPLASSHGVTIIKVNVDQHRDLAERYQVSGLPTLVRVKDGDEIQRRVGLTQQVNLEAMVSE